MSTNSSEEKHRRVPTTALGTRRLHIATLFSRRLAQKAAAQAEQEPTRPALALALLTRLTRASGAVAAARAAPPAGCGRRRSLHGPSASPRLRAA